MKDKAALFFCDACLSQELDVESFSLAELVECQRLVGVRSPVRVPICVSVRDGPYAAALKRLDHARLFTAHAAAEQDLAALLVNAQRWVVVVVTWTQRDPACGSALLTSPAAVARDHFSADHQEASSSP
jgi:hypothetical protein